MSAKGPVPWYGVVFLVATVGAALGAFWAFWALTEGEVRRGSAPRDVVGVATPVPDVPPPDTIPIDTTAEWQPGPLATLRDTLFALRQQDRIDEALDVLEQWLARYPNDRVRRRDAARLAFEVSQHERGVEHYVRYLRDGADRDVLDEAFRRILVELEPAAARRALAGLLVVDDNHFVRVGLARATSDAGDHAGADTLLAPIPPFRDGGVDSLRLIVRRSLNPDIPTATRWVSEYPGEVHYRLVLARALARGERYGDAVEHYVAAFAIDTTVALREEAGNIAVAAGQMELAISILEAVLERDSTRTGTLLAYARALARFGDYPGAVRAFERLMAQSPDEARFAEARGVLFEVDDAALTLPLLSSLVAYRPDDDALRLRYAQDLERTGALAAAEAQYDTLVVRAPSGPLLLARARLRVARNDLTGALVDAGDSEKRAVTVDAPLLQGEIHRWRDERVPAHYAYGRAALVSPDDERVVEGRRLLDAQRKRALSELPPYGTHGHTNALGDSDGFASVTVRAHEGFAPLIDETVFLVGGELRRVGGKAGASVTGFGGDIGAARVFGRTLMVARAGALAFDGRDPVATALLEATRAEQYRSFRASVARQPAYESLRSASAIAAGDVLNATTALASIQAQLTSDLELYVQADHTWISNGNSRSVAFGVGRFSLNENFALLYSAGALTFGFGDSAYWSPERFISQGVGLDIRRDKSQGWSVGARLSPAYAWVRETTPDAPDGTQGVFQGTAQADATWRRSVWEITAYGGYGRDRAGTYVAGFGGLRVRVTR